MYTKIKLAEEVVPVVHNEIPDALDRVNKRISYLGDRLDVLLIRIGPVVSLIGAPEVEEAKSKMITSCELGRRLYDSADLLEDLADKIDSTLERLEL